MNAWEIAAVAWSSASMLASTIAIMIARDALKKVDKALEIKIAPGSYLVVSKSDAK